MLNAKVAIATTAFPRIFSRQGQHGLAVCLLVLAAAVMSLAQDAPAPQPSGQSASGQVDAPSSSKKNDQSSSGTSNDRLFYALPNFLTLETGADVPPLTTRQKYATVARGAFDPIQFAWYGFLSAISQAEDSEPGFGQGWGAYGERYGSAAADSTIENFMTGAVLPSLFHEDPRFFQKSTGTFKQRAGYAVTRIFVTRTDSGGSEFNYSEILGSAGSAFISTYSYHPQKDRTVPNTMSVWGSQVGYDTITIVVKEFWPDIRRKLHKPKPVNAASTMQP